MVPVTVCATSGPASEKRARTSVSLRRMTFLHGRLSEMFPFRDNEATTDSCAESSVLTGLRHRRPASCFHLPGCAFDPGGQVCGWHGAGHVEALGEIASELAQPLVRLRVLDSLGHDPASQVVTELNRRVDDGVIGRVRQHLQNERLVDLDLVDGKKPQM